MFSAFSIQHTAIIFLLIALITTGCEKTSPTGNNSRQAGSQKNNAGAANDIAAGDMRPGDFSAIYAKGTTLVYFAKTVCPACKKQEPLYGAALSKLPTGAKAIKVYPYMMNFDYYGIEKMPTFIVFKNGRNVWKKVGVTKTETLLKAINQNL